MLQVHSNPMKKERCLFFEERKHLLICLLPLLRIPRDHNMAALNVLNSRLLHRLTHTEPPIVVNTEIAVG